MVGSAAIKQGRSANRKHTYFFFGLSKPLSKLVGGFSAAVLEEIADR